MRPQILFPLFADLASLRGVGARLAGLYGRLCGNKVVDLLWHLPAGITDRRYRPQLKYADRDRVATLSVTIAEHAAPRRRGLPYRIVGYDDTDQLYINYFNVRDDGYLGKLYPAGEKVAISGFLERYQGGWSMNHPDYAVPAERIAEIPPLEPIYPLTEGLSNRMLRRTVAEAIKRLPALPEWHDPHLMRREGWPDWKTAVVTAHDPSAAEKSGQADAARRRLAYDELLADQLALLVIRLHNRSIGGVSIPKGGKLAAKLESVLPFMFTGAQRRAIAEISADMASPKRMLRLLQGDVGAGKTVVAVAAMLQAADAGMQAALLAPTEILARQHYDRVSEILRPLGVKVGLLTGRGARGNGERKATLESLADGGLGLVVGTHALFQDGVNFRNLGLVVVDEQHRFGVQQRMQMADKGRGVNSLVMTATPIPRTLTLTAYGDMDVSRMDEKPAGRKPIDTRVINADRVEEVIASLKRKLGQGEQAYWVCPLIEESEKSDLKAATQRAEILAERLGEQSVGLVHGRMASEAKDKAMADFCAGKIRVLVATTVIEVGVDVPTATLMIIEHSERFGLAQLHQLRGRVGRGGSNSACVLLYQAPLNSTAKARLKMLRDTEDGFRIAEEDLRLRGPGELLGTRQSGLPLFRLSGPICDSGLLDMARTDAEAILARDPELAGERSQALRLLMYLFEKDAAVGLFRS